MTEESPQNDISQSAPAAHETNLGGNLKFIKMSHTNPILFNKKNEAFFTIKIPKEVVAESNIQYKDRFKTKVFQTKNGNLIAVFEIPGFKKRI